MGFSWKIRSVWFKYFKNHNAGCGFLYFSGHGSPFIWMTNKPNGNSIGFFSLFHIPLLTNSHMQPICLSSGCNNAQFNTILPCWSWMMVKTRGGGSIASIGYTGLVASGCEYGGGGSDALEQFFFKAYNNGNEILGKCLNEAMTKYFNEYSLDWNTPNGSTSSINAKIVQECVLLGDPSLKIGGYH